MTSAPSSPGPSCCKRQSPSLVPLLIAVLTALALSGCVRAKQAGEILWPGYNDPFVESTKVWTRNGASYSGLDFSCQSMAVFQSPEWRRAYVERYAKVYSLSEDEKAKLLADQEAAAAKDDGFILGLTCTDPSKGVIRPDRQSWQVFVQRGQTKTYPVDLLPLDWPESKFEALLPGYTPWQNMYQLRFPAGGPGPVELVVSGPDGVMRLNWDVEAQPGMTK